MRLKTLLVAGFAAFAFASPAAAQYAGDEHDHGAQAQPTPAAQPEAPTPVPAQIEDLDWQTELGFEPEQFRSHVVFLADDLLEGREAGTRGYDLAARYVASQFAGLGVLPGNKGSWYQQVSLGPLDRAGRRQAAGRDPELQFGRRLHLHAQRAGGPDCGRCAVGVRRHGHRRSRPGP
jgi:hypothetical protein